MDGGDERMRYHTRENHNYHLERFNRCVYCLNGNIILDKEQRKLIVDEAGV